jgi:hypothetical protein
MWESKFKLGILKFQGYLQPRVPSLGSCCEGSLGFQ